MVLSQFSSIRTLLLHLNDLFADFYSNVISFLQRQMNVHEYSISPDRRFMLLAIDCKKVRI